MKYSSVLSLGSNCVVAGQIQRYFGGNPQSPFDWLVTPFDSLIKILQSNGESLGLSCSPEFLGSTAYCENYGVLYHHEFKRNEHNRMIYDIDSFVNLRNKMLHKYKVFHDIARTSAPLFIRYLSGTNVPGDRLNNKFPITRVDINLLQSNLEMLCGHRDFHIALFRSSGCQYDLLDFDDVKDINNFSIHEENYQGEGILGEDSSWDIFFRNFNLASSDRPLGVSYKL